jgi:hypothetical protein
MPRKKVVPDSTNKNITTNISDDDALTPLALSNNKENAAVLVHKLPSKRIGAKIHAGTRNKKIKNTNGNTASKITMKVEGYAFQDDIIGVTHVRSDGEDAFNLTLRNMILSDSLEDKGFSSYITLRDKSSGKNDDHLCGSDGYPRYMFMSINVHNFNNINEASNHVLKQCEHLHNVSSYSLMRNHTIPSTNC